MAVIYLCPADKRLLCSWEGYASDIKQHFENEHNGLLFHTNSVEIDLDNLEENRLLYLQEEIYLIQSCIQNNKLLLRLRLLGANATASKRQYDITITVKNISYKYQAGRKFSCVIPRAEGWEINLELLEKYHGKLQSLSCEVLIENKFNDYEFEIGRKSSNASLKINNSFVEKNVCDPTEAKILESLSLVEGKLKQLKLEQEREIDEKKMEQISQSDVSISLEKHVFDPSEASSLEASSDEKLNELRLKSGEKNGDIMDRISLLNLSILEEPFIENRKYTSEDYKTELLTEGLPDIPEELNLSCSSCRLDMLPPIYLCINGHNVCSWCKSDSCKICNGAITVIRNTDLENISRTHKHLCRYAPDGCNEKLLYNEVRGHEARCQFCKYKCASGCPYEGKFQHFLNHLKIVHTSVKISFAMRSEFPKNSELYIVNQSIGIFFCKSEQKNDFITWKATFCGPKERQFFCELTFKGSKFKEPIFMKRHATVYEIGKSVVELKKMKAKEKYALLIITSYDN